MPGLLLATAFLWGVTFVAGRNTPRRPCRARLRRRALCCVRRGARAVRAVGIPPEAACAQPRRMAPRARDRPHALLRHEPAAGRDRDDDRHQRRLLTACYVVLTPFVVWALAGARPRAIVVGAGFVSLIGAWLLATGGAFGPPNVGDALVLRAHFAWATGIALTPFSPPPRRPLLLAFVQYTVCAAPPALCSALFELPRPRGALVATAPTIFPPGVVSGALAYTIQFSPRRIRRPPWRPSSWRLRASSPRLRARSC